MLLKFQDFLNESTAPADIIQIYNEISKVNKERDANRQDTNLIPSDWKLFSKHKEIEKSDKGVPHQCYKNSLDYTKKTGAEMWIGIVLNYKNLLQQKDWQSQEPGNLANIWTCQLEHAWNIVDGKIYDRTINKFNHIDNSVYAYIGFQVHPEKYFKLKDSFAIQSVFQPMIGEIMKWK